MSENFNFEVEEKLNEWREFSPKKGYNLYHFHHGGERQSPFSYDYSYLNQDRYYLENFPQDQQLLSSFLQPIAATFQNKNNENKKIKRSDDKSKCFQQHLASKCRTLTLKIISLRLNSMPSRQKMKELTKSLDDFLKENKAKYSQLIVPFIYLYFKRQSVDKNQLIEMGSKLLDYLDKRSQKAQAETESERKKIQRKTQINRALVEKYFGQAQNEVSVEWIKGICGQLFTGKHKKTIEKPLRRLQELQLNLTKAKSQQTHYQSIQSFFE